MVCFTMWSRSYANRGKSIQQVGTYTRRRVSALTPNSLGNTWIMECGRCVDQTLGWSLGQRTEDGKTNIMILLSISSYEEEDLEN